jgi:hypothetical protein
MKTMNLFICCGVLALCAHFLWFAPPARGADPDWKLLDETTDSRFYYDQSGAEPAGKGVFKIRTRVVYSDEGKAEALKMLQGNKDFEKLAETRYKHDLDCNKEQSKLLEARHLDQEGATIKSTDLSSSTEWEEIPPGSRMEMVQDKVCAPQPAKK